MYCPPLDKDGNLLFVHDARWLVPQDYYDDWRTWYGWVHKRTSWTCFEKNDLLVIGPGKCGFQRLSGTLCLYLGIENRRLNRCLVHSQWGIEETIPAYRLVPVQLCEPVIKPELLWTARYPLKVL